MVHKTKQIHAKKRKRLEEGRWGTNWFSFPIDWLNARRGKNSTRKLIRFNSEKSFFSSFQQTEKQKKNICKTIAQQKSAQLKEGAILLQQVLRVFFQIFASTEWRCNFELIIFVSSPVLRVWDWGPKCEKNLKSKKGSRTPLKPLPFAKILPKPNWLQSKN
jgi:hypothetical protein